MRSRSLARVVMACLGVSVAITPGCGGSPSGPAPSTFSVLSMSPSEGSSAGGTRVVIAGTGFLIRGKGAATVTVDGSRVDASPSIDGNTISLLMPAHATGKVDVTVIGPLGQAQASVPGGYTYVAPPPPPPPVISELVPNIGSTSGGTPVSIKGTGVGWAATVTVGGIASPFVVDGDTRDDPIHLESTPAHAAGTVEVILTDRWGQTASAEYTYASPSTFDFNGDWEGWAEVFPGELGTRLVLTIRDNIAVSVLCLVCRDPICAIGSAPSLTLDPPPVVANGEFSFAGSGGVSLTGKILSPNSASGSINTASCGNRRWSAQKW